jgi:multidrug efflux pump subunit AcrA (membrane-fusion protein)
MPRTRAASFLLALAAITGGAALMAAAGCRKNGVESAAAAKQYRCAMHPQIVSDEPGKCPICQMDLVLDEEPPRTPAAPAAGTDASGRKVLYWYDPMAPGSKFDKPGKSPFMDMQLVPKYADEETGAAGESAVQVGLSPEAIRATGVAVVPVEKATVAPEIRAVGTIETDETKLVRVAARVAGRIEKLFADYTGEKVARGAPLYSLYSPDLVATQREYLLALENRRRLAGGTEEAKKSAEDLLAATRDRLRLWGIGPGQIAALEQTGRPELAMTFRSPIDGTVLQKAAVEGQYVAEGTELYLLADLSSVWLVAQVYEFELSGLETGQPAEATVSSLPGRVFRGRVSFIEPVLERETRSARVRIVLPNPKGALKPGMFADALIRVPEAPRLVVPRAALIDTGTRRVVYVETAANTFTARNVIPGSASGDRVEILEGLKEGERVVAEGNFFIDSQAQLSGGQSIQWSGALDVKTTPTAEPKP